MSGRPINQVQIKVYKEARKAGRTQKTAAAMAGISERSGRRIERGELPRPRRYWRTHPDAFTDVWAGEIEPLLERDSTLKATVLFRMLQRRYPGRYPDSKLRTFQRRVKAWKSGRAAGRPERRRGETGRRQPPRTGPVKEDRTCDADRSP